MFPRLLNIGNTKSFFLFGPRGTGKTTWVAQQFPGSNVILLREDGWPNLRLRYGLADGYAYTLEEVGKIFSVTRERVRQIEREVMAKLRNGERADRLRSYAS